MGSILAITSVFAIIPSQKVKAVTGVALAAGQIGNGFRVSNHRTPGKVIGEVGYDAEQYRNAGGYGHPTVVGYLPYGTTLEEDEFVARGENFENLGAIFCVEAGVNIASWTGSEASKSTRAIYYRQGTYSNRKLEMALSFAVNQGYNAAETQTLVWYVLDQINMRNINLAEYNRIVESFIWAYNNNPTHVQLNDKITLYWYSDGTYNGQQLMSFSYEKKPRPVPEQPGYLALSGGKVVQGTNVKIPGVKFGIFGDAEAKNDLIQVETTTTNGTFVSKYNERIKTKKTYYVRELSRAEGQVDYVNPFNTIYPVTIEEGATSPETATSIDFRGNRFISNTKPKFIPEFTKADITNGNTNFDKVQYKLRVISLTDKIEEPQFRVGQNMKSDVTGVRDAVLKVNKANVIRVVDDVFEGIYPGTYQLFEFSTQDNANARLADTSAHITFEVTKTGQIVIRENTTNLRAVNQQNQYLQDLGSNIRIALDPTKVNSTVWSEAINLGLLKVVKLDKNSKQGLSGFRFKVKGKGIMVGAGNFLTEKIYETNQNGELITDPLQLGEYTVEEVEAPEPYRMAETKLQTKTITVSNNVAQAHEVVFENEQQLMDIRLTKTTDTPAIKSGAKFELKVISLVKTGIQGQTQPNTVKGIYTVDQNGVLEIRDLPLGVYELKEVETPDNQILNPTLVVVINGVFEKKQDGSIPTKTSLVTYTQTGEDFVKNEVNELKDELTRVNREIAKDDSLQFTFTQLGLPELAEIEVASNQNKMYNLTSKGRIELTKFKNTQESGSERFNEVEQGIVFEIIHKESNQVVESLTTNQYGKANSKWLPLGTYKVVQKTTEMLNGKPVVNKVQDFEVVLNTHRQVVAHNLINRPEFLHIRVEKLDDKTGRTIKQSGIKFGIFSAVTDQQLELKKPDGTTFNSIDIEELTGVGITAQKLPQGQYYLKEITGPQGYVVDHERKYNFTINEDGTTDIQTIPYEKDGVAQPNEVVGNLKITNQSQTGSLAIVKFADQFARWEKETKEIIVFEEGKVTTKEVEEAQANTTLKVLRKFKEGTFEERVVTDSNGYYAQTSLKEGEYQIFKITLDEHNVEQEELLQELVVPENRNDLGFEVQLPKVKKQVEVREEGKPKTQTVEVQKAIYENRRLAGATFKIVSKNELKAKDNTLLIANKGEALWIAKQDFVVNLPNNLTYNVRKGDVVWYKDLIENGTIKPEWITQEIVTEDDKDVVVNNIPLGEYQVVETQAPFGYLATNEEVLVTFEPQANNKLVESKATPTIQNTRQKVDINLGNKVIEKVTHFKRGENADGVYFGLYNTQELNGLPIGTLMDVTQPVIDTVEDKFISGVVSFENVPLGVYEIRELYTKDGYVLNGDTHFIDITQPTENKNLTRVEELRKELFNNSLRRKVTVRKIDQDTNTLIRGAKLRLEAIVEDGTKTVIEEWVSEVGDKEFSLVVGNYQLTEVEAPIGYVNLDKPFEFAVDGTQDLTLTLKNRKTEVGVRKVDALHGKHLDGATLKLVDDKGQEVFVDEHNHVVYDNTLPNAKPLTWVSELQDTIIRGLLPEATYKIVEVLTPQGYLPLEINEILVNVQKTLTKQLVTVLNEEKPDLKTTATSFLNKLVNPAEKMELTDRVYYELKHNGPYEPITLDLAWMDKTSRKVYVDADGKEAKTTYTFTPKERKGYVDVSMWVNGSNLFENDTDLVAFETMKRRGLIIAVEHEWENEDQTVKVRTPKFKTKVNVGNENHEVLLQNREFNFTDTVSGGIYAKGTYEVVGTLHDTELEKPLLDKDGKEYVSTVQVELEEGSHNVDVPFTINPYEHQGKTITVFEEIYQLFEDENDEIQRRKIGEHKDYKDKNQTFKILKPKFKTKVLVGNDQNVVDLGGLKVFKDLIIFENVAPGRYLVKGLLANRQTKELVLDQNGKPYEATLEVEYKGLANGEWEVVFKDFNPDLHRGLEVTVLEDVYRYEDNPKTQEDREKPNFYGSHRDFEDDNQAFKVSDPKMKTKATISGEKAIIANGVQRFKDVISHWNYATHSNGTNEPLEYEFETKLYSHTLNGFIQENGQDKVFRTRVTLTQRDGEVVVEYEIDTDLYQGHDITLFESAYRIEKDKDGKEVKVLVDQHHDKEDKDQTFRILPKPVKIQTGDTSDIQTNLMVFILAILTLMGYGVYFSRKENK